MAVQREARPRDLATRDTDYDALVNGELIIISVAIMFSVITIIIIIISIIIIDIIITICMASSTSLLCSANFRGTSNAANKSPGTSKAANKSPDSAPVLGEASARTCAADPGPSSHQS